MDEIVRILAARYSEYIYYSTQPVLVQNMISAMVSNVNHWPIDKLNRWLGFIQGILFMDGLIAIDEERDFTRPLFHNYYINNGIQIPSSIDLNNGAY